jgi:hypothetical protein
MKKNLILVRLRYMFMRVSFGDGDINELSIVVTKKRCILKGEIS